MPIPRVYDPTEQAYHVYGRTCSPGCAKAYVIEHTTFDKGQHLNVLVHMLREVFGIDGPVAAAPPRQALRRFGGVFDPRAQRKAECRLVTPPASRTACSSRSAVARRRCPRRRCRQQRPSPELEEADTFDEPTPPAMFADFVATRGAADGSSSGHTNRTRTCTIKQTPSGVGRTAFEIRQAVTRSECVR